VAKTITLADDQQLVLHKSDDGRFSLTIDHA
jgi:pyrimidine operon attenuation protein/uracil phosphoribosyltransferase